jgi:hypothetical protein
MFWNSVKSGFRQWYVAGAAFLILSLLDMVIALPAPTTGKYQFLFVAAMSIIKLFEKQFRQWVASWSETEGK